MAAMWTAWQGEDRRLAGRRLAGRRLAGRRLAVPLPARRRDREGCPGWPAAMGASQQHQQQEQAGG
ncbi:MAG: hypothetical protein ACYC2G_14395, partial [Gemmatimonadaceae bacterium]